MSSSPPRPRAPGVRRSRGPKRTPAPPAANASEAPPAPDAPPARPEPVRLAAVRAYLAFVRGGPFAVDPPRALSVDAQRRLYVQLLRGVVRHRSLLESEVARLAKRPLGRMDDEVVCVAMLGLYQLRFLETAPHAAVYETVGLLPALRKTQAKGLVNAVLRAAQREGLREDATARALPLAQRTSHPAWLVERWRARYGAARARSICEANNRYAGAALRVELGRITPAALRARLADEGVTAEPHPLLRDALWVEQLGALLAAPAFRDGLCYVQDAASQLLLAWAAPVLSGRVLDACAAPGGKLTYLLGLRRAADWIVGAEPAAARMAQVRENLRRLRVPPAPLLRADARRLPFAAAGWDAVLVDAPCSATGMIRKYPELKWRKHPADLPRFAETQAALLAEAARVVRPGGCIVYVTCSLEPEENEVRVRTFLQERPGFHRRPFSELPPPAGLPAPDQFIGSDGDLLVLPGPRQMGLYAAVLERTA